MQDHPIDPPGYSPVLELTVLTREELSALTSYMRRAAHDSRSAAMFPNLISDFDSHVAMLNDLTILRLEVRAIFLDRLAQEA